MKIHLDEIELKDIIQEHLVSQMPDLSNRNFDIQLIAGRGDNGHRAEVEIVTGSPQPVAEATEEAVPADEEQAVPSLFGNDGADD